MSKIRIRLAVAVIVLGGVVVMTGCGTVAHGRFQQVPVMSTPAGASVLADCGTGARAAGETPVVVKVSRKADRCVITLKKDGYRDESVELKRHLSGWVWGNIFLPYVTVPAVLVDLYDGGAYRRSPESIDVNLRQETASSID